MYADVLAVANNLRAGQTRRVLAQLAPQLSPPRVSCRLVKGISARRKSAAATATATAAAAADAAAAAAARASSWCRVERNRRSRISELPARPRLGASFPTRWSPCRKARTA